MKVAAALLANSAVVDGSGLLHVDGGGWDRYSADSFPSTLNGAVCGVLELSQADVGMYRALRISVTDTGGQADASRGSMIVSTNDLVIPPGVVARVSFAVPFVFVVTVPGLASVRLQDETNKDLIAVPFEVRRKALDPNLA